MSLIPSLKLRLARYCGLVDLGAVDEPQRAFGAKRQCTGDRRHDASRPWSLQARKCERHSRAGSLAEGIGDPLVRNRGTLGGSIANADPAADYPAAVVGLGATVWTNQRRIDGDGFFCGLFETALERARSSRR